jgi:DNA-binding transcriptional MerR regulator
MADPAIKSNAAPEIPDKLYFRIGEVSRLAGVKPFVLRYWESEFPSLGPKKSGTGQRLYRRKEVELVLEIKRLLYDERFTIEGARNLLSSRNSRSEAKKRKPAAPLPPADQGILFPMATPPGMLEIRKGLAEILDLLK